MGCNLGKALTILPIALPRSSRVLRDCHVASLLAMTHQGSAVAHQRPPTVELSRTRRSLTAATGPVGTGSILTIVCAYRQHCAGRGMPRPSAKRQSDGQFGAMHRSRRHAPLICHCEERSDVAISGRQLRFCRGFPVIRPGTARLPRRFAPRNDTSGKRGVGNGALRRISEPIAASRTGGACPAPTFNIKTPPGRRPGGAAVVFTF